MSALQLDILLEIEKLFDQKKWNKKQGGEAGTSLYHRFCERLKLLSKEQQLFLLEISKNYLKIELTHYLEAFYDSMICLGDQVFDNKDKIFVAPLLKPYIVSKEGGQNVRIPRNKTKSADFLHYLFETDDWTWLSQKFIPTHSIKKLKLGFTNNDSILLLVDDYVGSGGTAIEACKDFLVESYNNEKILPENIKVVTIAAQEAGINKVKAEIGVEVVTNLVLSRGISDFYPTTEIPLKLDLMLEIEEAIGGINEDFSLGLERSEALITFLGKTPNNTFPVYWHETKTKIAPFPRYKKYKGNG